MSDPSPQRLRTSRFPRTAWLSRQSPALLAAVAAATLTVAGCSSGSSPSSSSSPATGASAAGKSLTLASAAAPASLAPTQLNDNQDAYIWDSVYDTLLVTTPQGKLESGAAASWAYTDGGKTLTLTLRKGMSFSDGTPVTAADVAATLHAIATTPGPNEGDLAALASVAAPTAGSVVIHLKAADPDLLTQLSMGAGVVAEQSELSSASAKLNPVGSGPYTIDASGTTPGSAYVLRKRAGYWNAAAYPFQSITVKVLSGDTALANAMLSGQVQAGSLAVTSLSRFTGSTQWTITKLPGTAQLTLVLADRAGTKLKPLGDLRVRQAINMALDRAALAKAMFPGMLTGTEQVFSPGGQAYQSGLDSTYQFDPAKAKQLLAQAGYPGGFTVTMPEYSYITSFAPLVSQSLAAIGIKVSWQTIPDQDINAGLASGNFAMYPAVIPVGSDSSQLQYMEPGSAANPFNSQTPQLTALLTQVDAAVGSSAGLAQAEQKIDEYAVDNAWLAPVVNITSFWVTAAGTTFTCTDGAVLETVRNFGTAG
jgi:peptide/nickel transport system substrate-binding protein